ncbi:uncharacterized protein BXZ73DRAFT_103449 [Epithele typhae]|uniref:uncharacterized protein n=1 Tax=Epithele typhae TaxID=378194 RepID=UPI002007DA9D|nr:uncharacterized protein BXZ73DRAFT_103449 [Epithele typhae]KAH9924610.1 hypothetical protein BXZ73DRAFT_103449 [Epithele typhae]
MIDVPAHALPPFAAPLNEYNVHALQFALHLQQDKPRAPGPLAQDPLLSPHALDIDYAQRRMSSSATSDSSLHSPPLSRATFTDRHELRRASLPTLHYPDSAARDRLPYPLHRPSLSSGSAFPFDSPGSDRPYRLDTTIGPFPGPASDLSSLPSTAITSAASSSSFGLSPLTPGFSAPNRSPSNLSDPGSWNAASIARPNSTPSATKYDDSRPESMFAGVQRIAGHDRTPSARIASQPGLPAVKSEHDWTFPTSSPDFAMSPSTSSTGPSNPSISVTNSPDRSPHSAPGIATGPSLVDRGPPQPQAQRKRGKLPKPVTDFLKDWLHRHSDHPYPSEEEKKQLCHATGLSMSQVSNWMINARRRILAPARHSAAGPTTTTPFATRPAGVGMGMGMPGMGGLGGPLDPSRRMSVDSLQLYYPMSLQSLGEPHHLSPTGTRHMVSMTRSLSSSNATAGNLGGLGHHGHGHSPYALSDSYPQTRMSYGGSGGGTLHPSAHSQHHGSSGYFNNNGHYLGTQGSMYSSGAGYAQSGGHHAPQGGSPGARVVTPGTDDSASYRFPEHSASPGPHTGSGYATPQ